MPAERIAAAKLFQQALAARTQKSRRTVADGDAARAADQDAVAVPGFGKNAVESRDDIACDIKRPRPFELFLQPARVVAVFGAGKAQRQLRVRGISRKLVQDLPQRCKRAFLVACNIGGLLQNNTLKDFTLGAPEQECAAMR